MPYVIAAPNLMLASRRTARGPASLMVAQGRSMTWSRRPKPSVVQFSGTTTVTAANTFAEREVQLRLRDGTIVDAVRSNPANGYFEFTGWYGARDDYEYHVIGDNYVSTIFPLLTPPAVQWNGNPNVNSSTP